MQTYQQTCRVVIEKYEGHVAQYLGDGLMVYFGFPRAHEDDAERAVRSALDIVSAMSAVPSPDAPLRVRIGIATGPVVVGETGSGDASVPKLAAKHPTLPLACKASSDRKKSSSRPSLTAWRGQCSKCVIAVSKC